MIFTAWGRLVAEYERRILNLLSHRQVVNSPFFHAAARKVAEAMAREAAKANEQSWRTAAYKSTNARKIYQALQDEIRTGHLAITLQRMAEENAQLITSLPLELSKQVSKKASDLFQQGMRPEEVAREIRRLRPAMIRSRVQLIARTELSKAETNLTQVRAQKLGLEFYQWVTSEDQRVRLSHRKMNKVLVAWGDPPSPESLIGQKSALGHYQAGACPNCRCMALPIADLNEVRWPAKLYSNGSIRLVKRSEFVKLAGIPLAA